MGQAGQLSSGLSKAGEIRGRWNTRVLFVSYTASEVGPTRSLLLLLDNLPSSWIPLVVSTKGEFLKIELAKRGIELVQFSSLGRRQVFALSNFMRSRRIQLVYCNTADGTARTAVAAARMAMLPVICHVRAMRWGQPWWKLAHLTLASHTIAVSAACANSVRRYVLPNKLSVVHNGVDLDRYPPSEPGLRSRLGIDGGCPLVVAVGHYGVRKNQLDALKVARGLMTQNVHFHMALLGRPDAEPAYTEQLREFIAREGLADNVTLLGFWPAAERNLAEVDLLIHTAVRDPHPRAVLEAMAAGIPIVAYEVDGVAETVEDGKSGYLAERGDVEALTDATKALLLAPELSKLFGREGRKRVREHFSDLRTADSIDRIMRQVMGQPRPIQQ